MTSEASGKGETLQDVRLCAFGLANRLDVIVGQKLLHAIIVNSDSDWPLVNLGVYLISSEAFALSSATMASVR